MRQAFSDNTAGLVAIINNRPDFERAREHNWYRIPVRTAPDDILTMHWVAFYLTQVFGRQKWSVRYWAEVKKITRHRRRTLLPAEADHPRANNMYFRLELGDLQERAEPIYSRRRRRIVFIPTIWRKFSSALEINDLAHGSPLEDRLWAAMQQEGIEAERQWWEGDNKKRFCLDFAVFCPKGNIDVECDGDTYHNSREAATYDNERNNFLTQLGWQVLRFNTPQIRDDLNGCTKRIVQTIDRCGGMLLADETIRRLGVVGHDGSRQLPLF